MALVDQIRAARETWVTAGGFHFLIRRPTKYQLVRWSSDVGDATTRVLRESVIGWKDIPGHLIAPGLDGSTPPFEMEAFLEWVGDRPDVMIEIGSAVNDTVTRYLDATEAAEKK